MNYVSVVPWQIIQNKRVNIQVISFEKLWAFYFTGLFIIYLVVERPFFTLSMFDSEVISNARLARGRNIQIWEHFRSSNKMTEEFSF